MIMGPLLDKLSCEKKEIILMGDLNINILNYDSDKDTADYASSLCPTKKSSWMPGTCPRHISRRLIYWFEHPGS